MAADFIIKRGDRQPALTATLSDSSGVINLTGATVRLKMKLRGASTLKVDAACTITSAAGGAVRYAWGANDTDTAGMYDAEFEITFGDATVLTVPNDGVLYVQVTEDLR